MSDGKRPRYVIFGAGAVGSTVGGLLARAGSTVVCVARPPVVATLSKGLVLKLDGREIVVKVESASRIQDLKPGRGDIVVITTKSQVTESVIDELAGVYERELRVVCLQNGARNEEIARRTFENIYAGLVFFSAVQLAPGSISLPQGLKVAVGCYPEGVDDTARQMCNDLTRAGFDALASSHVMPMKWGKLDECSEDYFYNNRELHGATLSNACVERSADEFLNQAFAECKQSPHFNSLSAIKAGLWPVVLVACRHYRIPVPLHLLQEFKNQKSPTRA